MQVFSVSPRTLASLDPVLPSCIHLGFHALSLQVFSVSPRHLDTRLGIVVTLFLSLTALQFIIAAGLPSSQTVVPTQQLIIVSDIAWQG